MKRLLPTLLLFFFLVLPFDSHPANSISIPVDSTEVSPKHPWRAALEVVGINTLVWGFNRFVTREAFAKVTPKTIFRNIKTGFVWDNDKFETNLFSHPYHGGLYFNAARNNGLSFWQSLPYSYAGSLLWEFAGENEPAAINDLLATTIGGAAIGEVTNRMSRLVLDDSKRGIDRVWRELLGFVISPMGGFNRLITGKMWKRSFAPYTYHDYRKIPLSFSVEAGDRFLTERSILARGEHTGYIELNLDYGNAFSKSATTPYDYFNLGAVFSFGKRQPLISEINLTARLWGKDLNMKPGNDMQFGIFQYFTFYNSEKLKRCSPKVPFRISEAASFGPGLIYRFPFSDRSVALEQRIFTGAVLLGGSFSDNYQVIDRDYDMGSGYSIKSNILVNVFKYATIALNIQHFQLFTWKGYEQKDIKNVDPLYLNVQGSKGNARLTVINPSIGVFIYRNLKANLETNYYLRKSHYKYHEDVTFRTFEIRLGIGWQFR